MADYKEAFGREPSASAGGKDESALESFIWILELLDVVERLQTRRDSGGERRDLVGIEVRLEVVVCPSSKERAVLYRADAKAVVLIFIVGASVEVCPCRDPGDLLLVARQPHDLGDALDVEGLVLNERGVIEEVRIGDHG